MRSFLSASLPLSLPLSFVMSKRRIFLWLWFPQESKQIVTHIHTGGKHKMNLLNHVQMHHWLFTYFFFSKEPKIDSYFGTINTGLSFAFLFMNQYSAHIHIVRLIQIYLLFKWSFIIYLVEFTVQNAEYVDVNEHKFINYILHSTTVEMTSLAPMLRNKIKSRNLCLSRNSAK